MSRGNTRSLLARVESGDLLLLACVAAVVREALWSVADNRLAWALTVAFSLAALWLYSATKEDEEPAPPGASRAFWLIVFPPLLFFYALRFVHPDFSFDVLNYHLFQSERATWGPLLRAGDYFPTPAPYNPAPNIIHGVFRHLLGYRLGTVVNLFALLCAARVVEKLLRPYVAGAWRRAAGVLLCVLAEQLLFQVNNYMVDLLSLPLTLEAARLALLPAPPGWATYRRRLALIAFLLGLGAALKLPNLAAAAPLVLLCAYRALAHFKPSLRQLAAATLLSGAALLAPLLPFCSYIYRETGSPVFPVYNGIFRSPYWPPDNAVDPRWGPQGLAETLAWPLLLPLRARQLSEMNNYSWRITLGCLVALAVLLFWRRRDQRLNALSFLVLASALLWSASTGYIRYALQAELLAPVLALSFAGLLWRGEAGRLRGRAGAVSASVLWALVAAQAALGSFFGAQTEWSGRPTIFSDFAAYRAGAGYLLRDRSLKDFFAPDERAVYEGVETWVVSGAKAVGVQALLNREVPFVNVRNFNYLGTPEARHRSEHALRAAEGKRVASLCLMDDFGPAMNALREQGLTAERAAPARVPFFTRDQQGANFYFYEVRREEGRAVGQPIALTESHAPLNDDDYRAEIILEGDVPTAFAPGETKHLFVRVKNVGGAVWPARGQVGGRNQFVVSDRWLDGGDSGARLVNAYDGCMALYRDLAPGEEALFALAARAPREPGQYVLEIDVVHEWVTSFREKGSRSLVLPVSVR